MVYVMQEVDPDPHPPNASAAEKVCEGTEVIELVSDSTNTEAENKITNDSCADKTYKCDLCQKVFKQSGHVTRHVMSVHRNKRPHVCKICQKAFTQATHLRSHESLHRGERPHICDKCGKKFAKASDLKRHGFTHTGERLHACNLCNKRFTQSSHLKEHKSLHDIEHKFSCNKCEKKYTTQNNLKKHMVSHIRENDFQCLVCPKKFKSRKQIQKHMLTHESKLCDKTLKTQEGLNSHTMLKYQNKLADNFVVEKKIENMKNSEFAGEVLETSDIEMEIELEENVHKSSECGRVTENENLESETVEKECCNAQKKE